MSYHSNYSAECSEGSNLIFQAATGPTGPPSSSVNVNRIVRFQSRTIKLKKSNNNDVAVVNIEIPSASLYVKSTSNAFLPITALGDPVMTVPILWNNVITNSGLGFDVDGTKIFFNGTGIYNFNLSVSVDVIDDKDNTFGIFVNINPTVIDELVRAYTTATYNESFSTVGPQGVSKIDIGQKIITNITIISDNPVGSAIAQMVSATLNIDFVSVF